MSTKLLTNFVAAIADGRLKVIDLTQTLTPSTPVVRSPPTLANSNPFRIREISGYDDRGPAWYWNNISLGEHTGTHFDAPCHWIAGKDNPDGYTDTVPLRRMIAPAVVIDCSREVAADKKFLCEPSQLEIWESTHGRIPDGAWVLMRTDLSKLKTPVSFFQTQEDETLPLPRPSAAAVRWLIEQRNVNGWGVEAAGTDDARAYSFEAEFMAHQLMHGANKLGLANLCNLDLLPPTGAALIAAPLKIEKGSGSPLRVLALVPT